MDTPNITTEIIGGHGRNLGQAARCFPPYRENRPVSPATVFRWITSGVRLATGGILRLEARRIGGRWLTSTQAIERFIEAQTPQFPDQANTTASTKRSVTQRQHAAERAGKKLEKMGA